MVNNASTQDKQASSNTLLIASGVGVALAVLVVIIWMLIRLVMSNQAIAQGTGELPPAANNPLQLVSDTTDPVEQESPPIDGGAPPNTVPEDVALPDNVPAPINLNRGAAGGSSTLPIIFSGLALVFSLAALGVSLFLLLGNTKKET